MLDRYGAAELQAAILSALSRGVPHPHAVRLALETQREARDPWRNPFANLKFRQI